MTASADLFDESPDDIPDYPMPRAEGCPFDPPPALRTARRRSAVTKVRLWDGSTPWLVTGYAAQRELLADSRLSSDVTLPGFPHISETFKARRTAKRRSFINFDDPEHGRLRRMVTAPFTARRIEAMRPHIQRIVDDLIDGMAAGPRPVDLVESFALAVPSLVICELLGVPYEDHGFFQQQSRNLINSGSAPDTALAAQRALHQYLDRLVEAKNAEPGDDLLSELVVHQVRSGALTSADVTLMSTLLLVAGHETTANMIALGTLALLEHPDQLALLRRSDDTRTVAQAVEELLRFLTVIHTGRGRVALADLDVEGKAIRAGDGVILVNSEANRDETAFPDPDRLDLTRDARRHLAFGFGAHQCLGQALARVQLQVVHSTLHRRLPNLRLAVDRDSIRFKREGLVYGVWELPVTW
ncbi:cytochrome P450 [Streptomyces asoensis]|uniref:cytochrome P450 n=1 Tax=Streptomyces asoensis TaxID=249586 RepID=UPI0033C74AEA